MDVQKSLGLYQLLWCLGLSLLCSNFEDYAMLHCSKTFTIMLEKSPIMLSKLTVMLNENSLKSHSKHNNNTHIHHIIDCSAIQLSLVVL